MKLIDILWSQGTSVAEGENMVPGLHNESWFTNSNMAFQTMHVPDPRMLDTPQYQQGYYVAKEQRLGYDNIWTQDLPDLFPHARVIHVDIASQKPKTAVLKTLTALFSFTLDCQHAERKLNRAVYLRIVPSKNKEQMFPFVETAGNTWSVTLPASAEKSIPKDGSCIAQIVVPYRARTAAAGSTLTKQIIDEIDVTNIDLDAPVTNDQVNVPDYGAFVWKEIAQWEIGTKPKGWLSKMAVCGGASRK
jgi:hypothetical protein